MKALSKSKFALLFFIGVAFAGFANEQSPKSNVAQQQQSFVKVKDGRLYYNEIGQGIPIIVVHGGPGLDHGYLQPQLSQLAANHRLIFYDQRGSGKSLETPLDEDHINIHQFVEDLEDLRKSLGLNKFVLMGHSWGGLLAMQYAVDHQDHLIGLILLNSAPADYKGQKAFIDEFGARTKNVHNDIKPLFAYEDFKKLNAIQISDLYRKLFSVYVYNSKDVKDLSLNFSVASAQSGFKVMEEMTKTFWLQPNINLFPKLKTLMVPTFILHGKQDIVPAWTSEEIKNAIPNAEMVILDHCDHFSYIEQPSQFFSELNGFLDKIQEVDIQHTVEHQKKKSFIGLELRTNNEECSSAMPAHKERFFGENVPLKIPNKVNGNILALYAEPHLDCLVEYDQQRCSDILQAADLPDLWNYFLKGQTDLYFDQEAEWLSQQDSWVGARAVLELGSGNGAYLSRLSEAFNEKTFVGVEKQPSLVEQSSAQFDRPKLTFIEGDAEVEQGEYRNQFDVVLYRLTLQHLKNPKLSLQLAHQYLKQDGHVIVIDSYDPATSSSHEIHSFKEASRQHNERNRATLKGNRRITIEFLEELQTRNSSLSNFYEVVHTSLDVQGNRLEKGIRFESEQDRKRYFTHALLFLSILKKGYEIPVDLSEAYKELQVYLKDENSWICPGMHFLVLKKI